MEIFKTAISFGATIVGTSIMLPQIVKSLRTKSVTDISWGMLVLYGLNCLLWLTYGILIIAIPLVITNAIALCISIFQIGLKLRYSRPA